MQLYAKGIEVEIIDVGALADPAEYARINPLGTTPTLVVGKRFIPDSAAICEYLEEVFADPPLLPVRPMDRARTRSIAQLSDQRILLPSLDMLQYINTRTRDMTAVEQSLQRVGIGLGRLRRLMSERSRFAAGDSLTLADCMLVPTLFIVTAVAGLLQVPNPLDGHDGLQHYKMAIADEPAAARILAEMETAMRARFGATG